MSNLPTILLQSFFDNFMKDIFSRHTYPQLYFLFLYYLLSPPCNIGKHLIDISQYDSVNNPPASGDPLKKGVKEGYEQAFLRGGWGDSEN